MVLDMTDDLIYYNFYDTHYIRPAIKSNTHSSCWTQFTFPLAFKVTVIIISAGMKRFIGCMCFYMSLLAAI